MVWDDINESETQCPKCHQLMVWQYCQELGCDGGIVTYETDSEYDVTSYYCSTCNGRGIEEWCQNCGYGVN